MRTENRALQEKVADREHGSVTADPLLNLWLTGQPTDRQTLIALGLFFGYDEANIVRSSIMFANKQVFLFNKKAITYFDQEPGTHGPSSEYPDKVVSFSRFHIITYWSIFAVRSIIGLRCKKMQERLKKTTKIKKEIKLSRNYAVWLHVFFYLLDLLLFYMITYLLMSPSICTAPPPLKK